MQQGVMVWIIEKAVQMNSHPLCPNSITIAHSIENDCKVAANEQ
jgi:hypothetical protein